MFLSQGPLEDTRLTQVSTHSFPTPGVDILGCGMLPYMTWLGSPGLVGLCGMAKGQYLLLWNGPLWLSTAQSKHKPNGTQSRRCPH